MDWIEAFVRGLGNGGAPPLPSGEGWGEGLRSIVRPVTLTRIAGRCFASPDDPTSPDGRGAPSAQKLSDPIHELNYGKSLSDFKRSGTGQNSPARKPAAPVFWPT